MPRFKIPSSDLLLADSAPKFRQQDIDLLKVSFKPAPSENHVIPEVEVTDFPKKYFLPNVGYNTLSGCDFNVDTFDKTLDDRTKTFLYKLHRVVRIGFQFEESYTDSLVNDLLVHAAELDDYPFAVMMYQPCKLSILGTPFVAAEPEFVVKNEQNNSIVVADDKHLRRSGTGYGETQIAGEILSCVDENMYNQYEDQTIFAVRVITSYVTFYKAEIPELYWDELDSGFPRKQSIEILRWPKANGWRSGFDLADPDGRKAVITGLAKIRQFLLLKNKQPAKNLEDE